MLYDKRWDYQTETKTDPFSLDSLIAWLEKQPADKTYCYLDNGKCLHCQYFKAAGFRNVFAFGYAIYHGETPLPAEWDEDDAIRNGALRLSQDFVNIAVSAPYTFAAALARARKAQARS